MILNGGSLAKLAAHYVGNKSVDETLILTDNEINLSDPSDKTILNQHFLDSFKASFTLYSFKHEIDLSLHELKYLTDSIFADNTLFLPLSQQIAQLLFNKSLHPKILPGDLYVALFDDCIVDGEIIQALGIFKFEDKQIFIKSNYEDAHFNLSVERGVLQKRIDRAALIFNTNTETGNEILLIDRKNSSGETQHWVDEFLKINPISTPYLETQNYISLTKNFISDVGNDHWSMADKASILHKSADYFKSHQQFAENEFVNEVLQNDIKGKELFDQYKVTYQQNRDIQIAPSFEISTDAIKNSAKFFRKVIKLDQNFDIYIHGNKELVEQGFDKVKGRKYYKFYYENES